MGSPLSPIVANLYMESFEVEPIRSAPLPPYRWKIFVDDTFWQKTQTVTECKLKPRYKSVK